MVLSDEDLKKETNKIELQSPVSCHSELTQVSVESAQKRDCLWCGSCAKVYENPDMFMCTKTDEMLNYIDSVPARVEPYDRCPES